MLDADGNPWRDTSYHPDARFSNTMTANGYRVRVKLSVNTKRIIDLTDLERRILDNRKWKQMFEVEYAANKKNRIEALRLTYAKIKKVNPYFNARYIMIVNED